MANPADVTDLIGHIRKAGFKVTKSGNQKHWKVLSPKGAVLVDDNGPLIISGSPSDNRWREMTVKRLMALPKERGGPVLTVDPYKPTKSNPDEKQPNGDGPTAKNSGQKGGKSAEWMRSLNDAKVAAIKAKSQRLKERTARLRARFEPVAMKLGGWSTHARGSGLTVNEVADVVFAWAHNRGRVELPRTTVRGDPIDSGDKLKSFVQNLKTPGNTIGEKWLPLFELFVDELERDAGTPPQPEKAAARYMELLREAKGISPGPSSPRPLPPPAVAPPLPAVVPVASHIRRPLLDDGELRVEPGGQVAVGPPPAAADHAQIGPRYQPDTYVRAPQLALDALYEMASRVHPSDTAARERHMQLATQIAELELNERRREDT